MSRLFHPQKRVLTPKNWKRSATASTTTVSSSMPLKFDVCRQILTVSALTSNRSCSSRTALHHPKSQQILKSIAIDWYLDLFLIEQTIESLIDLQIKKKRIVWSWIVEPRIRGYTVNIVAFFHNFLNNIIHSLSNKFRYRVAIKDIGIPGWIQVSECRNSSVDWEQCKYTKKVS